MFTWGGIRMIPIMQGRLGGRDDCHLRISETKQQWYSVLGKQIFTEATHNKRYNEIELILNTESESNNKTEAESTQRSRLIPITDFICCRR